MANRAYLFFDDQIKQGEVCRDDDSFYMDSRHTLPYLWFLFFDLTCLRFRPVFYGDSAWHEEFLVEDWPVARARFLRRLERLRPQLQPYLEAANYVEDGSEILPILERFEQRYLILDPSELDHLEGKWPKMLREIDDTDDAPERQHQILKKLVSLKLKNDCIDIIGAWYV